MSGDFEIDDVVFLKTDGNYKTITYRVVSKNGRKFTIRRDGGQVNHDRSFYSNDFWPKESLTSKQGLVPVDMSQSDSDSNDELIKDREVSLSSNNITAIALAPADDSQVYTDKNDELVKDSEVSLSSNNVTAITLAPVDDSKVDTNKNDELVKENEATLSSNNITDSSLVPVDESQDGNKNDELIKESEATLSSNNITDSNLVPVDESQDGNTNVELVKESEATSNCITDSSLVPIEKKQAKKIPPKPFNVLDFYLKPGDFVCYFAAMFPDLLEYSRITDVFIDSSSHKISVGGFPKKCAFLSYDFIWKLQPNPDSEQGYYNINTPDENGMARHVGGKLFDYTLIDTDGRKKYSLTYTKEHKELDGIVDDISDTVAIKARVIDYKSIKEKNQFSEMWLDDGTNVEYGGFVRVGKNSQSVYSNYALDAYFELYVIIENDKWIIRSGDVFEECPNTFTLFGGTVLFEESKGNSFLFFVHIANSNHKFTYLQTTFKALSDFAKDILSNQVQKPKSRICDSKKLGMVVNQHLSSVTFEDIKMYLKTTKPEMVAHATGTYNDKRRTSERCKSKSEGIRDDEPDETNTIDDNVSCSKKKQKVSPSPKEALVTRKSTTASCNKKSKVETEVHIDEPSSSKPFKRNVAITQAAAAETGGISQAMFEAGLQKIAALTKTPAPVAADSNAALMKLLERSDTQLAIVAKSSEAQLAAVTKISHDSQAQLSKLMHVVDEVKTNNQLAMKEIVENFTDMAKFHTKEVIEIQNKANKEVGDIHTKAYDGLKEMAENRVNDLKEIMTGVNNQKFMLEMAAIQQQVQLKEIEASSSSSTYDTAARTSTAPSRTAEFIPQLIRDIGALSDLSNALNLLKK